MKTEKKKKVINFRGKERKEEFVFFGLENPRKK